MLRFILFFSALIFSGCAKFSFNMSSLSSTNNGLSILVPNPNFLSQPDEVVTISGTCQAGADLNITGSGMVGAINILCSSDGTFSNSIAIVSDAVSQNIVVTQTDASTGEAQTNDDSVSVTTHCAPALMATCSLSGSGRSFADPYVINTIECLQEMRVNPACHFALNNDIDATATSTWNGGQGWETAGSLTGTLNGRGHRISNLTINRPTENNQGLFTNINGDYLANPSEITVGDIIFENFSIISLSGSGLLSSNTDESRLSNIQIINSNMSVDPNVSTLFSTFGGVSSRLTDSLIENSQVDVSMTLSKNNAADIITSVGGLASSAQDSEITNTTVDFSIVTTGHLGTIREIGGVIGNGNGGDSNLNDLTVQFSANLETSYSGASSGISRVGGITGVGDIIINQSSVNTNMVLNSPSDEVVLVGGITGDTTFGSYTASTTSAAGSIAITSPSTNQISGLVGLLEGSSFTDCISSVDLDLSAATNNDNIGGITGESAAFAPALTNTVYTGNLNIGAPNSNVGSFIGSRGGGLTITNSFFDSDVVGAFPTVGSGAATGVNGLTTPNMYLQGSFTGFDFTNIWQINSGVSYPELQ